MSFKKSRTNVPAILVGWEEVNLLLLGEREGDKGGPAVGRHDDAAPVAAALALVVRPQRDAVAGRAALVAAVARASLNLERFNSNLPKKWIHMTQILRSWYDFNHFSCYKFR